MKMRNVGKKKITNKKLLTAHCSLFTVLCSLLIVTCSLEMHAPKPGYLYINIDTGSLARTIRPDLEAEISSYNLYINDTQIGDPIPKNQTFQPVSLEYGTHTVRVTGYFSYGAIAEGIKEIDFNASMQSVTITLKPVISDTLPSTFSWDISFDDFTPYEAEMRINTYPGNILYNNVISPINNPIDILTDDTGKIIGLPAGSYYLVTSIKKDETSDPVIWTQILHIYQYLTSHFEFEFTEEFFAELEAPSGLVVTNLNDTTNTSDPSYTGSLRRAIENADAGDTIIFQDGLVTPGVSEIRLSSTLLINKSITLEGSGVVLTRDTSWTDINANSQLLFINIPTSGTIADIKISRIHFKDGRSNDSGAAIRAVYCKLTLESCIFNGNKTSESNAPNGGAINISNGSSILTLIGCTFYDNTATGTNNGHGGAIYTPSLMTINLYGNLFFATLYQYRPILAPGTGIPGNNLTINASYNVVNVDFGTNFDETGWSRGSGDALFTDVGFNYNTTLPFVSTTGADAFTPLGTGTLHTHIPVTFADNMPAVDFYGNQRTFPGAPGAVNYKEISSPGSEENPWQINQSTIQEFIDNGWNLNEHYVLTGEIELDETISNNWTPIGTDNDDDDDSTRFNGTFDGAGFRIKNVRINKTSEDDVGLFGSIGSEGIVKNIVLENVTVTGKDYVGSLAGSNYGTIEDCIINYVTINGANNVGGLVGWNGENIKRSAVIGGTITGASCAGGITGTNQLGIIQDCYSTINVTLTGNGNSTIDVGGIVGANFDDGTIERCYATGEISGRSFIGGIAGSNGDADTGGTIQNCVGLNSSLSRTWAQGLIGRITGDNYTLSAVTINNYADANMLVNNSPITSDNDLTTIHGRNVSPGTASNQYNNQDFWDITMGWDFVDIWEWDTNTNLPKLQGQ